jgi:two-component system, chemotaxis family, chemotaxis protein CheY
MDTSLPILVVDDSQTTRLAITKRLQSLGFADIDLAQDGTTAIEWLSKKRYGLVLSDWEMQPMGGAEFLRILRMESNVPVILITATASQETSRLVRANVYLPKPFNEGDLEAAIKRALLLR